VPFCDDVELKLQEVLIFSIKDDATHESERPLGLSHKIYSQNKTMSEELSGFDSLKEAALQCPHRCNSFVANHSIALFAVVS